MELPDGTGSDPLTLEAQLERPLRASSEVVVRCHLDLPLVIAVPPLLDDGTPFPTRYWLTCPLAKRRIGRIESAGGVRAMQRWVDASDQRREALEARHRSYGDERDALIPEGASPIPTGGVGGSGGGIKCLHAHFADATAGNENLVGEQVRPWVEPLDCSEPCVVPEGDRFVSNPRWREPE